MPPAKAVTEGVAEAWAHWLDQHPITVDDLTQAAIEKALTGWLDAHRDVLIVAIAEAIAKRSDPDS